jgi:hypothetical protein
MSIIYEKRELSPTYWEINSPKSKRDLIIKKIAITLIAIINLAALGAIFYLIVSYCPISTQALLISPFIVGVLGTLVTLKFPTFGINSMNYTQYSNPSTILGKIITYFFFGPYMYATKKCDWNVYHDPHTANLISNDLATASYEEIDKKYSKHFNNFAKYGIIPPEFKKDLNSLSKEYKPIKTALKFYHKKNLGWHEKISDLNDQKEMIEQKWAVLRDKIHPYLSFPKLPEKDFGDSFTKWGTKIEDTFYKPPFQEDPDKAFNKFSV